MRIIGLHTKIIFTLTYLSFAPFLLFSQSKTFTGPGNFSDNTLWNGNTLPTTGENLIIKNVCTFDNAASSLVYGTLTLGSVPTAGTINWPAGGTNTLIVTIVSAGAALGNAIDMTNGGTLKLTSWVSTNMTFTPGTGTIEYIGTTTMPADITTYNNLKINIAAGTVTLGASTTVNGTVTLIAGVLDVSLLNFNITISGDWTNNGGSFIAGTGTVTFNSTTAAQNINGTATSQTFNNITVSKIGQTLTVGGTTTTLTINSTLTLSAGTFDKGTATTINLAGNFTNNAIFTSGAGTVIFNGSAAQTIGGTTLTAFNNITINNSSGGVSLTANQNLTSTLTLTLGTFTTTGQVFTLISNASGTARIAEVTGGSVTGNVTVQRRITGNDGWRSLSSPVSGTDIEDWNGEFAMSGFNGTEQEWDPFKSVRTYNETILGLASVGFETPSNTSNALVAGKGYFAWIGDGLGASITKTIDLTGTPNTGLQTLSVTYTDDPGQPPSEDGWNLVGNPFVSTINWDAAGWTKTNVSTTIATWRDDLLQYAQYTTGGPDPGPNGGKPTIASMQGFWVQTTATAPALTVPESAKSATDQPFFKQTNATQSVLLVLKITATNGFYDETMIRLMPQATNGFEWEYDAFKLFTISNIPPRLSSVINDSLDLGLNSLGEPLQSISIPLRVQTKIAGNFVLNFSGIGSIPAKYCALLYDKAADKYVDLSKDSSYTFFMVDTTKAPRFTIQLVKSDSLSCIDYFNNLTTTQTTSTEGQPTSFIINANEGMSVQFNYPSPENPIVSVFNLLGQKIYSDRLYDVKNDRVRLNIPISDGMYMVRINDCKRMVTHKAINMN